MPHFLRSGASTLSDPNRLDELFLGRNNQRYGLEFGEWPNTEALMACIERAKRRFWGLHVPALRGQPKYFRTPNLDDVTAAAGWAAQHGGQYVLAHLPYIDCPQDLDWAVIAAQAAALANTAVPVVAELKLARESVSGRSAGIFTADLQRLVALWQPLQLCLDIGDAFLAAKLLGRDPYALVAQLAPITRVVHVHTVYWPMNDKYIWEPVHPRLQQPHYLDIEKTLDVLRAHSKSELIFVYEYTPHLAPTIEVIHEGFAWFEGLVMERGFI
jgi:hypothetical protein